MIDGFKSQDSTKKKNLYYNFIKLYLIQLPGYASELLDQPRFLKLVLQSKKVIEHNNDCKELICLNLAQVARRIYSGAGNSSELLDLMKRTNFLAILQKETEREV